MGNQTAKIDFKFRRGMKEDRADLLKLWDAALAAPAEYFNKRCFTDPLFKDEYTCAAFVDGKPVSSVSYFPRSMYYQGKIITIGGIGNVATYPEYRGHGLASRLMEEAEKGMKSAGCEFGLLFTGIQPFYEKLGWWIFPITEYRVPAQAFTPAAAAHETAVTPDSYADAVELYDAAAPRINGAFTRPENYWKPNIILNKDGWVKEEAFNLVVENNSVIGYYRAKREEDCLKILEFIAIDDKSYIQVIAKASSYAKAHGLQYVSFQCMHTNPAAQFALKAEGASHSRGEYMMGKVLNAEKLAEIYDCADLQWMFTETPFAFLYADAF